MIPNQSSYRYECKLRDEGSRLSEMVKVLVIAAQFQLVGNHAFPFRKIILLTFCRKIVGGKCILNVIDVAIFSCCIRSRRCVWRCRRRRAALSSRSAPTTMAVLQYRWSTCSLRSLSASAKIAG